MKDIGREINHIFWGKGIIISQDDKHISVRFSDNTIKSLEYPSPNYNNSFFFNDEKQIQIVQNGKMVAVVHKKNQKNEIKSEQENVNIKTSETNHSQEYINKEVFHKLYGKGKIIGQEEARIIILFENNKEIEKVNFSTVRKYPNFLSNSFCNC